MTRLSDTGQAIAETVERILAQHCAADQLRQAEGGWDEELWNALMEAGAPLALEPKGRGEFDLPVADALHLVALAAGHAAPVPLAETMLGNWLLLSAGLGQVEGAASVAGGDRRDRIALSRDADGWRIGGAASNVPWGRCAAVLVLAAEVDGVVHLAKVPASAFTVENGENLAREPRDTVRFDGSVPAEAVIAVDWPISFLRSLGAALRVTQISGALDSAVALTVRYAGERVQFGKPLAKLQAVQQNIAIMGGETAAARAAAALVAQGFGDRAGELNVGAAKVRVADAVTTVSRLAHQVHGAIGITQEYDLHFRTKRLWAWRDEFGSDTDWARLLGREVLRRGAEGMWPFVTHALRGDAPSSSMRSEAA
jgi:acyl-CoA dehydrogenase